MIKTSQGDTVIDSQITNEAEREKCAVSEDLNLVFGVVL